jgi:ketosteroid isomerase-like protein
MNNKRLASLVFEALNKRDFNELHPFLNEEIVLNFPGVGDISGTKRIVIFMKTLLRKYPELHFNIQEVISEGDSAVAVWTNSGKKISGEDYSNSGNTLFHFIEGRISLISDYFKDTTFTLDK